MELSDILWIERKGTAKMPSKVYNGREGKRKEFVYQNKMKTRMNKNRIY